MLSLLPRLCAYLATLSDGGDLPAFNELTTPDRVLAASIQAAVESAAADVASSSGCHVLYIIHTPKEASPLRISEDLESLRERRKSLSSLLEKGIPLVVVHNSSESSPLYKENLEKYPSLLDVVTNEPLEAKSGATLIISQTGSAQCFYFEVTAQQVDAPTADAGLSFKFGDSSDARILDLMKQRMDLLGSIPVRPPASAQGEVSLSEFLGSVGLSFPVSPEVPGSVTEAASASSLRTKEK
ncbi:hypothetical protein ACJZTR_03465 [Neorickettsia risticii]|uniref:Uncharacterized protein n=1 Tax=Neorickettsia risticii (strain Illinois) TaxID=434131 RepID=C6V5V7_NEORI|nr:hypothetical protein [Neorickettsia risticii]ACT69772.1 conserved hypothetical protein [Neorickettsia risticii str. Illinois]